MTTYYDPVVSVFIATAGLAGVVAGHLLGRLIVAAVRAAVMHVRGARAARRLAVLGGA